MTTRRGFMGGLIGSLIAAHAVIRTPGLLMPIKPYPEIGWLPYDNALNAESLEIMVKSPPPKGRGFPQLEADFPAQECLGRH
jgi:hypothetical protein